MVRNFQCKSCGIQFSADDSQAVECPFCQSDIVEPIVERKSILRILLIALVGIVIIIGVALFVNHLKQEPETDDGQEVVDTTLDSTPDPTSTPTPAPVPEPNPDSATDSVLEQVDLIISVGDVVPDKKTKSYSFSIDVKCALEGVKRYYLAEKGSETKKEYHIANGMIMNVPPAVESGGGYVLTVEIIDAQGNVVADEQKDILGFDEFKNQLREKLSYNEVLNYINVFFSDPSRAVENIKNSYAFADGVIFIINRAADSPIYLDSFYMEVKVLRGISTISVTNVEYDDSNLVLKVYLEGK